MSLPIKWFDYNILAKRTLITSATGIAPWECHLLLDFIEHTPGHVVEIGTHRGDTAREIITAFPTRELHCVDNNMPVYGLKTEEICEKAKDIPGVCLHLMDSKDFKIPAGTGVVFIDGDHSWEGVKADTENALRHFRTHHGVILWHDYNTDNEVMPYLERLRERSRLDILHVSNTSVAFLRL